MLNTVWGMKHRNRSSKLKQAAEYVGATKSEHQTSLKRFLLFGYTFRGLQCVHVQLKYGKNIHLFPDEAPFTIKTG